VSGPWVNFTNILRAAFTRADPKSANKQLNLTVFFALLGSARVKAARRTLVKLTQVGQFHQRVTLIRSKLTEEQVKTFQGFSDF